MRDTPPDTQQPQETMSPDPQALYARMRPDQRTAVANEFLRVLTLAGDPAAERFAPPPREYGVPTPPAMETPEQVTQLHTYVRERRPDLFAQVMAHPVVVAALETAGSAPLPVRDPDLLATNRAIEDNPEFHEDPVTQ